LPLARSESLKEATPRLWPRHRLTPIRLGTSMVGAVPGLPGMVGNEQVVTFYQLRARDAMGIGEGRSWRCAWIRGRLCKAWPDYRGNAGLLGGRREQTDPQGRARVLAWEFTPQAPTSCHGKGQKLGRSHETGGSLTVRRMRGFPGGSAIWRSACPARSRLWRRTRPREMAKRSSRPSGVSRSRCPTRSL
jgi:hypothetical protein